MRHFVPLNQADEYDVFLSWRKRYAWCGKAGATNAVKTRYRRRERLALKKDTAERLREYQAPVA